MGITTATAAVRCSLCTVVPFVCEFSITIVLLQVFIIKILVRENCLVQSLLAEELIFVSMITSCIFTRVVKTRVSSIAKPSAILFHKIVYALGKTIESAILIRKCLFL